MSKKFLILIIISIMLGFVFSKVLKSIKKSSDFNTYNAYLLQIGAYTTEKNVDEYVKNLNSYVIDKENGKYYVYIGITSNENNIEKLEKLYDNENIYIKKVYINNSEFINNLKQYDILLNELTDTKDIGKINEVILDSYMDLIKT